VSSRSTGVTGRSGQRTRSLRVTIRARPRADTWQGSAGAPSVPPAAPRLARVCPLHGQVVSHRRCFRCRAKAPRVGYLPVDDRLVAAALHRNVPWRLLAVGPPLARGDASRSLVGSRTDARGRRYCRPPGRRLRARRPARRGASAPASGSWSPRAGLCSRQVIQLG
jgi:hypothetical protein